MNYDGVGGHRGGVFGMGLGGVWGGLAWGVVKVTTPKSRRCRHRKQVLLQRLQEDPQQLWQGPQQPFSDSVWR